VSGLFRYAGARGAADKEGMATRRILQIAAVSALLAGVSALVACDSETGLSKLPNAAYAQLECYDINGDHVLNDQDAADPAKLPDFDNNGKHDALDAAFFKGIDIPLNPQPQNEACTHANKDWGPEYFVAHSSKPATVDCSAGGPKPVLLYGAGGGVSNLKHDAAGVRSMLDGLQKAYAKRDVQTLAVVSGESIIAGEKPQVAMEQWSTHTVQTYLDRYPCLRVLLLGHSHGSVTVNHIAAQLEPQYASRMIEVVDVDRIDVLYTGDTTSWPQQVHLFNIYETNDDKLKGSPHDAPNTENWDASGDNGPKNGDEGGALEPVNHTTIDNSSSVKQRIIDDVMRRSG
jgi:hypothetical protein